MKYLVISLSLIVSVGCALDVEEEPSSSGEAPVEETAQELDKGAYSGGGGLVFGNNDYGDCLHDCSLLKAACEARNLRIITDRFELAEPCDLEYSFCKADCQRAHPQ